MSNTMFIIMVIANALLGIYNLVIFISDTTKIFNLFAFTIALIVTLQVFFKRKEIF